MLKFHWNFAEISLRSVPKLKSAAHDYCFPAGLHFSKLLKLHQTEGRISNNLLFTQIIH